MSVEKTSRTICFSLDQWYLVFFTIPSMAYAPTVGTPRDVPLVREDTEQLTTLLEVIVRGGIAGNEVLNGFYFKRLDTYGSRQPWYHETGTIKSTAINRRNGTIKPPPLNRLMAPLNRHY